MGMKRLAIVGSGIAGLACVFFLHQHYDITLIEKNNYLGGHTNTITLTEGGNPLPIDTGFMVFNKITYPNLLRFFNELNIEYQPTDMSFSVNHIADDIQWNGAGLNKLFSQRKNLFRPRFYRLLNNMNRFCQEAKQDVEDPQYSHTTIREYARARNYPADFLDLFLVPMSGAIWSTSSTNMLNFPIQTLLRFFLNHGFLGLDRHFQWYTVTGGSKTYIETLKKQIPFHYQLNKAVQVVTRHPKENTVSLTYTNQETELFDHVILASHADQSLAILDHPTQTEQNLLSPFQYEKNETLLHTDETVMPSIKNTWAAWNYRIEQDTHLKTRHASTHYWMNRLQDLKQQKNYFVSLNASQYIDPEKVLKKINYEHPLFSLDAIQAQASLPNINKQQANQPVLFCGSYFKYGFHEDAFTSALNVCKQLTGKPLWT